MRANKTVWNNLLWLLLMLLGIWGCSGYEATRGESIEALQPMLAGLPGLPLDDIPGHVPSETTANNIVGSATWQQSAGAVPAGDNLGLTAAAGALEYALYRFETGLPETSTYATTVVLSLSGDNEVWIGLSDYTLRRWALSGPYVNDVNLPLDNSVYLSPAGSFYLAVIAHDGNTAAVNSVSFSYDDGVAPPDVNYLASVKAILDASCISCHGGSSPTAGIDLDSFRGARTNSAKVITKAVAGSHMGLSQADKDSIQAWVDAGTPYGTAITYTNDIQQLVSTRCATCHTTGSSGGVNLATYAGASANAANALTQILSENMPQSGGPLNNDQKDWWQVWVDDGTPE